MRSQVVSCLRFEPRNHPIAPLGCLPFMHCACCSQGGGVYIHGGTVSFDACNIYDNEATYVSVCCSKTPFPIAPMGSCLTLWLDSHAGVLPPTRLYVPRRLERPFPLPRWETLSDASCLTVAFAVRGMHHQGSNPFPSPRWGARFC